MTTTVVGPLNSYGTGVSGGNAFPGDAATGHEQRQFISYVDELEPYNTKFLSMFKKGKSVWKTKLEAGVRVQTAHAVTLNEALDNSETGIDLASGDGVKIHNGMVLYIPDDGTNAAEIVWVPDSGTNVSTDTITVVRAQGGTSAVAHNTGLTIQIIGVALSDLANYPEAPITFGNLHYNYRQRFSKKITVDAADDIQHNWEDPDGNVFERRLAKIAKDLKLEFEKALMLGRRQAGTQASGAKRPPMMSGVDHFAELSGNTADLSDGLLTIYDLEDALRNRKEEIDANAGDLFIHNYATQAMLDTAFNIKRMATMSDTSANLQLTSVTFGVGSVNFLPLPSNRWPDGKIDLVKKSNLVYFPYEGLDWTFFRQAMGVNTDGSYEVGSISGDFNYLPEDIDSFYQITGFDTNVDNYPRDLNV